MCVPMESMVTSRKIKIVLCRIQKWLQHIRVHVYQLCNLLRHIRFSFSFGEPLFDYKFKCTAFQRAQKDFGTVWADELVCDVMRRENLGNIGNFFFGIYTPIFCHAIHQADFSKTFRRCYCIKYAFRVGKDVERNIQIHRLKTRIWDLCRSCISNKKQKPLQLTLIELLDDTLTKTSE